MKPFNFKCFVFNVDYKLSFSKIFLKLKLLIVLFSKDALR